MCEPSGTSARGRRLAAAGCIAAAEEAAELLAAAPDPATLETWLTQREDGMPLAWIVGRDDVRRPPAGDRPGRLRAQDPDRGAGCPRRRGAAPGRAGPRPVHRLRRRRRPPRGRGRRRPRGRHRHRSGRRLMGPPQRRRRRWSPTSPRRSAVASTSSPLSRPTCRRTPSGCCRPTSCATSRAEPSTAATTASTSPGASSPPRRGCCGPAVGCVIELGGDQDAALRPDLAPAFDRIEPWHDDGRRPPRPRRPALIVLVRIVVARATRIRTETRSGQRPVTDLTPLGACWFM